MSTGDFGPLGSSFEFVHRNLDSFKIKGKVDELGIVAYIKHCARMAASTGAAAGAGGGLTLALGIPADIANTVTQQFRVTMAVIYHRTGRYSVQFDEFMKIVALSLGVEIGFKGLHYVVNRVAQEVFKRLTAGTVGKVFPLLGAAVGGGMNYYFIRGLGSTLLAFEDEIFNDRLNNA